jgi:hypothetical protein
MARPIAMTEEKKKQFKAICRLNPTLKDCAAFLEVSEDSIERYCKSLGQSFAEFRTENMVQTRFSLIRNALKMAEKGNPALMIFCLKNLCGWADKFESTSTNSGMIKIEISKEDANL